jgi:hypothetical protein
MDVEATPEAKAPPARLASEFLAECWPWIVALVLLAVVGGVWVWHKRYSAYDEAGLPRGPRL